MDWLSELNNLGSWLEDRVVTFWCKILVTGHLIFHWSHGVYRWFNDVSVAVATSKKIRPVHPTELVHSTRDRALKPVIQEPCNFDLIWKLAIQIQRAGSLAIRLRPSETVHFMVQRNVARHPNLWLSQHLYFASRPQQRLFKDSYPFKWEWKDSGCGAWGWKRLIINHIVT